MKNTESLPVEKRHAFDLEWAEEQYKEVLDEYYSDYVSKVFTAAQDFESQLASELPEPQKGNYEKWVTENEDTIEEIFSEVGFVFEPTIEAAEVKKAEAAFQSMQEKIAALNSVYSKISSSYTILKAQDSRKSLSTYLTLPASEFEQFRTQFTAAADFSTVEVTDVFTVRISDHETGSYTLADDLRGLSPLTVSYDNTQVQFNI